MDGADRIEVLRGHFLKGQHDIFSTLDLQIGVLKGEDRLPRIQVVGQVPVAEDGAADRVDEEEPPPAGVSGMDFDQR